MSKADELKSKNENLFERNTILLNENERLKLQIKKMKCCQNCKYIHCVWSSESIKDGKSIVQYWNVEKKAYCDVGEGAEYQLWEMRK